MPSRSRVTGRRLRTYRGGHRGVEDPTHRGRVRVARARPYACARVGRAAGRRVDAGRGVPRAGGRRAGSAARERRAERTVGPVLVRGGGPRRRGRGGGGAGGGGGGRPPP